MGFIFQKILLLLGDYAIAYVSLFLMMWIGFGTIEGSFVVSHLTAFSFLYPLWFVVFYVFDLYNLSLTPRSPRFFSMLLSALSVSFLIGVLYFYVVPLQSIAPKTNLLIHVVISGVLATFWRLFFFGRSRSRILWRVGLFSADPQSRDLGALIDAHVHLGYRSVFVDSFDDLSIKISNQHLNLFVLPTDLRSDPARVQSVYDCLGMGVTFLEPTVAFEFFGRRVPLSAIDHHWFLRHIQDREHGIYRLAKRAFDILVASFILIISSPIWFFIFLFIKIENAGPVFYRQKRVGNGRKVFDVLKFRTMRTDAEANGALWATQNDPRVTRFGKILRWTHLDELPQMINVLRGDISLVGPRPERPEFVEQLEKEIQHYHVRHFIKPGFTGWAQIRYRYARSVADSREKFEYDLYYIKNRSLVLDFLILLKTAQLLFRREN